MPIKYNIKPKIVEALSDAADGLFVQKICIGLTYTAVKLSSGNTGVAYTFLENLPRGNLSLPGDTFLTGKRADELLKMLISPVQLERAIGLATANAIAAKPGLKYTFGDSRSNIAFRKTDRVGMIGHFAPLVDDIRSSAGELLIFEIEDKLTEGFLPAEEAHLRLPECQVAIITATSIVNETLDVLLSSCGNCREVVLLGPSTPMVKQAFVNTPVSKLSGIIVQDSDLVFSAVGEGGGMRKFKTGVKKVNIDLKD